MKIDGEIHIFSPREELALNIVSDNIELNNVSDNIDFTLNNLRE